MDFTNFPRNLYFACSESIFVYLVPIFINNLVGIVYDFVEEGLDRVIAILDVHEWMG